MGSGDIDWKNVLSILKQRKVEPVLEVRSLDAVESSFAVLKFFDFES
ncbi:hypothetical protein [Methanogenium cariaci]|nr:hypothetical protein [Methanogenium cariaci]